MNEETFTPKTQGFLNNAKRIRVSRGLRNTRKGNPMDKWLIFHYLYEIWKEGRRNDTCAC